MGVRTHTALGFNVPHPRFGVSCGIYIFLSKNVGGTLSDTRWGGGRGQNILGGVGKVFCGGRNFDLRKLIWTGGVQSHF